MTTSTQTLSDWLLVQIAADEEAARRNMADAERTGWGSYVARMFAVCAAKRAILADHAPSVMSHGRWHPHEEDKYISDEPACRQCTTSTQKWRITSMWDTAERIVAPCDTIRILAQPYADRPGFRTEWRP